MKHRESQDLFLEFSRSKVLTKMAVACSVWKLGSSLIWQIKHIVIGNQESYSMKIWVEVYFIQSTKCTNRYCNHQASRVTFSRLIFLKPWKPRIPSSKPKVSYNKCKLLSFPTKWSSNFFDFWKFITHFFHLKLDLKFLRKRCFVFQRQLFVTEVICCYLKCNIPICLGISCWLKV